MKDKIGMMCSTKETEEKFVHSFGKKKQKG
jgi:hypothetical protein